MDVARVVLLRNSSFKDMFCLAWLGQTKPGLFHVPILHPKCLSEEDLLLSIFVPSETGLYMMSKSSWL